MSLSLLCCSERNEAIPLVIMKPQVLCIALIVGISWAIGKDEFEKMIPEAQERSFGLPDPGLRGIDIPDPSYSGKMWFFTYFMAKLNGSSSKLCIHYNSQLYFILLLGWSLVAVRQECDGAEVDKGRFQHVDECAAKCKSVASMFIFGTNEYGTTRCSGDGCKCFCETSATKEGTCNRAGHDGYRLYKYSPGDSHIFCVFCYIYI